MNGSSKTTQATQPSMLSFGYWFGTQDSSSAKGKMNTNDGTRTIIQQEKDAAKGTLEKFFNSYHITDPTDQFIVQFFVNKLPSVLVACRNTFSESHPLNKREDWLADKIKHLVPSFIQHAEANGFDKMDLKNPETVKGCLVAALTKAVKADTQVDVTQSVLALRSDSQGIQYILDVLSKANLAAPLANPQATSWRNRLPSFPCPSLARFKTTVLHHKPTWEGTKARFAACKTCCGKFVPTHEGIKQFFTRYGKYMAGTAALGGLVAAWFYRPDELIPEVSRQNAQAILNEFGLPIGLACGTSLTLAVTCLFNRYRKAPVIIAEVKKTV